MPKFRKKPVLIEAMQFTGKDSYDQMGAEWGPQNFTATSSYCEDTNTVSIFTLEGDMIANLKDWIIRGVKGEFYPCKPDIFAATYEPAGDPLKIICLDGFKTLEDFKNGLRQLRPDWFSHTDAVASDCCKATTETLKPN